MAGVFINNGDCIMPNNLIEDVLTKRENFWSGPILFRMGFNLV